MAKEYIGGTKLKEAFGDFLAVGPVSTQEVLLYPPHKVYAMNERTMTQTNIQKRRKPKGNSSSRAFVPFIESILLTKYAKKYIMILAQGKKSRNSRREPYHIILLKKENVEKVSPLKLKGKLSNYLIVTIEPLSEFYDKIQRHFKSSNQLEKRREAIR